MNEKTTFVNDLKCLRVEVQRAREDVDRKETQLQALNAELEKLREYSGKSAAELDNLTMQSNALEVR